jgi:CRISPR-associated protein Cmr2
MDEHAAEIDWRELTVAFLHDPPDKALDIRGHETRTRRYLEAALGEPPGEREIKMTADIDAAVAERLPMPTAGQNGERAVGPADRKLQVCHPLSGEAISLDVGMVQKEVIIEAIEQIVEGIDDHKRRFLALWRILPEALAADPQDAFFTLLPAETRVPDHTIWNHLDITAGLNSAHNHGGVALLSFALGPVQEFIAAAHTVRDLWSGSMLLAWITFQAMLPVIETCGPTALVYPSLRGLPWLDAWLREQQTLADRVHAPHDGQLSVPCLPNRFLAVVPLKMAERLAQGCRESGKRAWVKIASAVHDQLNPIFGGLAPDAPWDRHWDAQVDQFFSFQTSWFQRRDLKTDLLESLLKREIAPSIRRLADRIPERERPKYDQKKVGEWQAMVEYSARLMEAQRSVRHIPQVAPSEQQERYPKKCSLLGSFEQMGPAELSASDSFWGQAAERPVKGIRLRRGERLCAISLVKRFSSRVFFKKRLGLKSTPDFEDTATIAARIWLKMAGIDPNAYEPWNGQWLHWPKRDLELDDAAPEPLWKKIVALRGTGNGKAPVPTYYAILMLDGDHMGRWLSGEKAPRIREIIHPKMAAYFDALGQEASAVLEEKRPVGPAMHAAISQALANFAIHAVPEIVSRHQGTLIYSGGDDVLALLPLDTALTCAREIQAAFQGRAGGADAPGFYRHEGRDLLMMGPTATLSGGMAIVHYKYDLRRALNEARSAEKTAKQQGRDALVIRACRRSGSHDSVLCPWSFAPKMERFISAFRQQASDRFAYHLAAEMPTLEGLPIPAQVAELKRQIQRAEPDTRTILSGSKDKAGEFLAEVFETYRQSLAHRPVNTEEPMKRFVMLLQTASFMARGREE